MTTKNSGVCVKLQLHEFNLIQASSLNGHSTLIVTPAGAADLLRQLQAVLGEPEQQDTRPRTSYRNSKGGPKPIGSKP